MARKKSNPVADRFSDDEMEQIKRYGQALSGAVTALTKRLKDI
jgi:hypothetical protein